MSRKVLLAWELGGGRGHIRRLGWTADMLRTQGFDPVFAVRHLDILETIQNSVGDSAVLQAPVWLGFLDYSIAATPGDRMTFADIIGDLGFRFPSVVASMVRAWDSLIAAVQPAAVIADFSPACLLACRGRIPSVAIGNSFTLPPTTMERFTQFEGDGRPKYDEQDLVASVNTALRATGRPTIDRLPEIFTADRPCAGSFSELDPYAAFREVPCIAPWVPSWDRDIEMTRKEIFCYFSEHTHSSGTLVGALGRVASSGIPVRLHIPSIDRDVAAAFNSAGVTVEIEPVPFEAIQHQAGLVVSSGNFGFVSCALAAGIPQFLLPRGIAMGCTARAVQAIGAGRSVRLNPQSPWEAALLGQALIEAFQDNRLAKSAIDCAPQFARRLEPSPAEIVADLVQELV
jgi:rhamnosyltransferase subunit B